MSVLKFKNPNYTEGGTEEKWITLQTGGGIEEAPFDGKIYGRKDGQWAAPTLTFTDIEASTWVEDSTYEDFTYRCDLPCSGVLETDYAEVVFNVIEATSGVYAPVCRTSADIVSIWASENTTITVPTIIITR